MRLDRSSLKRLGGSLAVAGAGFVIPIQAIAARSDARPHSVDSTPAVRPQGDRNGEHSRVDVPVTPGQQPPASASGATPPTRTVDERLNRTGRTITITVMVKDGATYIGDADAQITAGDDVLISVDNLVRLLARRLDPDRLAQLRQAPADGGFASLAALAARGVPVTFDRRSFELTVTVALADRATQTIGLTDLDRPLNGDFTRPSDLSAYLNLRGAVDYVHRGGPGGIGHPFFIVDGAIRLAPVVLEGEGAFSGVDRRFNRDGVRLVYDDPRHLLRWTAGDLVVESRGFQGLLDIAGVGISRSYALLAPQRNVAPRGNRTFSIAREAVVEASVNGRPVRTLRLPAGTYRVSDFPFAQGGNDVSLVVTDDTGRRETISFSTFIERTQLAPGLSEFTLNAGVLSRRDRNVSYTGDPAFTGFYRRGVNQSLTLGANAQVTSRAFLVGTEAVVGTPIATIGGDVAISRLPGVGLGWIGNFTIERVTQSGTGNASVLAAIEVRSRDFGALEQLTPDNPYSLNGSLSYNRGIDRNSFAGVQLRYARGRDNVRDEQGARVSYGRRIGRYANLIFDVEYSQGARGDDSGLRVSLVRRFGDRTSARVEYDGAQNRGRLGVQTSSGYGIGAVTASLDADVGADAVSANATATYIANRADLGIAHSATYSAAGRAITDQRTSLRFATALAYAGGAFAIGRPISDSFAILRPYRGGSAMRLVVEQSQGAVQARSGALGSALYGQITSYAPRTLTFDAPAAPAGLDIGTGSLRVLAPYRSGYKVTVGSDYNVTVIGRLTVAGEPLALQPGKAVEIGGAGRTVELFTNRQGQFAVSGVKLGRWRIEIAGTPPVRYELTVAEAMDGIARVGDLVPMKEK